jgi:site-specific recombinase XerC
MSAALSKLFSWLVEHRKIAINPAVGMYKPKAPQARDRVLGEAEITWFWQACDTSCTTCSDVICVRFLANIARSAARS